jgi:hypothetical protein
MSRHQSTFQPKALLRRHGSGDGRAQQASTGNRLTALGLSSRRTCSWRSARLLRSIGGIGSVSPFRKALLAAIIDRIEVDDAVIRAVGRKDVLERAIPANGGPVPGVRDLVCNLAPRRSAILSSATVRRHSSYPCIIRTIYLLIVRAGS